MKTIPLLFTSLLLGVTQPPVQAQDFQAVPPAQRPNAAELAYFGSKHPNAPLNSDADNIRLVSDFLSDLISGQFEAAHRRLAVGFVAYGPGYNDKLEADGLLGQWEHDGNLFVDQHLTLSREPTPATATTSFSTTAPAARLGFPLYTDGPTNQRNELSQQR